MPSNHQVDQSTSFCSVLNNIEMSNMYGTTFLFYSIIKSIIEVRNKQHTNWKN